MKETFVQRFKEALEVRNMKQSDIVEKTGIGKSAISQYVSGKYEPKQKALYLLAQALGVDEAWLMGYDVPMDKVQVSDVTVDEWEEKYNPNGKLAKETKACELIQECYGVKTLKLVNEFQKLDEVDQSKILERIDVLLEAEKYSIEKESKNA